MRVYGAVGFDADQAAAFAEERYGEVVAQAAKAFQEQRWKEAADSFAEALSLEEVLDRPADREKILFHLTDACARSDQWFRAVHFQEQAVARVRPHVLARTPASQSAKTCRRNARTRSSHSSIPAH